MLNKYTDQLNKIIGTCLIHQKRLEYAFSKIRHLFPLNEESFCLLGDDEMAYVDQYVFRFAKYQDLIGGKLIKQILLIEGENFDNLSFRDIFNKAEKIGIAENWERWFELRQIRNESSHDYPVITDEITSSLNKMIDGISYLEETYFKCISYLNSKNQTF